MTTTKKTVKVSRLVSLSVNTENVEFVPSATPFENQGKVIEQVAIAMQKRLPVLLVGETGTGKTSLVRHLAAITNNGFRRVNHNGATTVDDIVGKILLNKEGTYWVDGVLVEAMRKGWWYLADEVNAASAEINFAYHSLLDDDGFIVLPEKGGEIVRPHPNFRFFAAMNPTSDYAGTKELNKAFLSRFLVVKMDFSPPSVEEKILVSRTGITASIAKKMVEFASEIRANHAKDKYTFVLSTRDLLMWASMYQVYKKFMPSLETTILNKINQDDLESIKDLAALRFKPLDTNRETKTQTSDVPEATA